MRTYKVTSRGRIVIPATIRKQFNIKPGTRIFISEYGNQIILEPITPAFYKNLRGSLKGSNLLDSLIEERKIDNTKYNQ